MGDFRGVMEICSRRFGGFPLDPLLGKDSGVPNWIPTYPKDPVVPSEKVGLGVGGFGGSSRTVLEVRYNWIPRDGHL